jgi:hypothetical protein
MSYGYDYSVPASYAPATERAAFIRRTYGHLAGAILAFIGLEAILLQLPVVDRVVRDMTRGWAWLVVMVIFMASGWIARSWARSETSPAMQYLGLGLYVLTWAVVFLPLLYVADRFFPGQKVIQTAGVLTLTIFGGLTIGVFLTGKDFSFLRPVLGIASWAAMGLIVCGILFGFNLGLFFMFAMVALASGYILYYTSTVIHHYRTDQHVAAALELFASVALLFYYILLIVMNYTSRD